MEQIKYKLGDLVYVVKLSDECIQDFKIDYGSIVSIYHSMDRYHIEQHQIIIGQEDYDDYDCDIMQYEVVTSHKNILDVSFFEVFISIQDALDSIRRRMESSKGHFEAVFDLEVASDTK